MRLLLIEHLLYFLCLNADQLRLLLKMQMSFDKHYTRSKGKHLFGYFLSRWETLGGNTQLLQESKAQKTETKYSSKLLMVLH